METMATNFLTEKLAAQAEFFVNHLTQTDYQYNEQIDADAGIFDCDCNSFVGFVLQGIAPAHYSMIPCETAQKRPRAFEYYDFFMSAELEADGGWRRIAALQDARRGDILAWRFLDITAGHDTGHVVFLADTPKMLDSGVYAVRVYDSADVPHFDDTRGDGQGQFPNGVGSGFLNFQIDSNGAPTAFQFGPGAKFENLPIIIGRAEPL